MSEKRFEHNREYFPLNVDEIIDNETGKTYDCEDATDLLNSLSEENEQLKKSEKINMEYAEQIVKENQKLRIAKNDLRIENEQLEQKIKDKNEYQRVLEAKIRRLKDRIKVLEKMSEKNCKVKQGENVKRFSWKTEKLQHSDDEVLLVVDNENKDWKGHILNIVELLNEQQELIEELRLQEKEKGVPVFVVREGKNPIALFFNEQRASLYCQENMANLTYQQEKWCRVE